MSLKVFHLVFILLSILLAFGFAAWSLVNYSNARRTLDLFFGLIGVGAGIALVFYFKYVLKKLKNMSNL